MFVIKMVDGPVEVFLRPRRYYDQHGPRTDDSWAADLDQARVFHKLQSAKSALSLIIRDLGSRYSEMGKTF